MKRRIRDKRRAPRRRIVKREEIDAIFEAGYDQQADVVIALYRIAFPNWDDIISVLNGWPSCGKELWLYVMDKCMKFDRKHHPDVMNGGLWFNKGWSSDETLGPWELDTSKVRLELTTSQRRVS